VLTVHAVVISSRGKAIAGADLALGPLLLVVGGLLEPDRIRCGQGLGWIVPPAPCHERPASAGPSGEVAPGGSPASGSS
jgi:hypothetical protein